MLPLEDSHLDILAKAQRGMKISDEELARLSALTFSQIQEIRRGSTDLPLLKKIASVLHLDPLSFVASAQKSWSPLPIQLPSFEMFTTPFDEMTVNAYLAWDPLTREAVVFDTGADVSEILLFTQKNQLKIQLILITHTHGDHIFDLDRLMEKTNAPCYLGDREPPVQGVTPFTTGKKFHLGSLTIETRLTFGHSPGGVTYVIHGLSPLIAVCGDALFAGSMGGGNISWEDALRTTREEILTLPPETIIAPGHGPLSTVEEAKQHNPFFA